MYHRIISTAFTVAIRRAVCFILLISCVALTGCQIEIYQGLSETQANTMLSTLLRHGIQAEKASAKGGYIISVEEKRLVQALEILRENSLPREDFQNLGNVFSAQGMISSATEEQARLSYALSQELADTFSRIDGVLTARVHVVLGHTDLSTGSITSPSAAVFLRHTPESQATRFIPYIRELASNSVPGLVQDKVSVMLVPVRETVSVPMPIQAKKSSQDYRTYLFIGIGILFVFAFAGLGAAFYLARRKGITGSKD